MKKLSFWKADWFLGLIVAIVMLVAARDDLIQSLERKAYDLGVQSASRAPSDRIAVVAIDDASIANIGRWPWSRDVHARMTDLLAGAKAKVVANTTFFFEPQRDAGLAYVEKLLALQNEMTAQNAAGPGKASEANDALIPMGAVLAEGKLELNTDRKLAVSMQRAGNVVLPLVFRPLAEPQGNPDKPLPGYVMANGMAGPAGAAALPPPGVFPLDPVAELGSAAAIGHLNADLDVDGAVCAEPLLVRYYDKVFPALSVLVAARSLNLGIADIKPAWGEALQMGTLAAAPRSAAAVS
jgi:eukaryotic-like serine/threonine-protein kinase